METLRRTKLEIEVLEHKEVALPARKTSDKILEIKHFQWMTLSLNLLWFLTSYGCNKAYLEHMVKYVIFKEHACSNFLSFIHTILKMYKNDICIYF